MKIKQVSLRKTKLDFSVIVVSKNLTSFVIHKFPAGQSWYAWNIFAMLPNEWVPGNPQKETLKLLDKLLFFDIDQTSILLVKENTKV